MVKVLLICTSGISTQKVVENMQAYVEKNKIDVEVLAIGDLEKKDRIPLADIILLGPQIRYTLEDVKSLSKGKLVLVMNTQDFGLLRGDLILKDALETYRLLV